MMKKEKDMNAEQEAIDISVIVLSYYHEKYIAQALNSILMQETRLRYEVLVGDDASRDRTQEIIQSYAEKYPDMIKPVLREENVGANYNSWDLERLAVGKYIAFLEGDDYWIDPQKLQKQWEFMENNPQYSACCGKCMIVDENSQPDYERSCHFAWNKRIFTLEDLVDSWQIPGQAGTEMYRNSHAGRQVTEEESGNEIIFRAHRHAGDKTGALLLLMNGPIYCFNDVFSCYRVVNKKGENNWFSIHHANPYRNYDMFMYPCKLEEWARKNMKMPRNKHFGKRNPYRFARFVEECVYSPSLRRFKYLGEMIWKSRQPLKYSWYVLKALIEMENSNEAVR